MKKFILSLLVLVVFAACQKTDPIAEMEGDVAMKSAVLIGTHFNLNIIGVKDKTMDDDIASGHVIFVKLGSEDELATSEIHLVEGDDFAVLDKNGTDEDGALFQLPDPGFEPYITELPFGFDTETDYSVWARPLGKPLTGATITTMADLSDFADYIIGKKDSRLFKNIVVDYGIDNITLAWGVFCPSPVELERLKGKQEWQNVTAELLSVVYEVLVTYDEDGDPATTDDIEELIFHARIPIFDEMLEGEYWKYDNSGLRLLQLRFYPFGTDVTYDDVENGWDVLP